MIESGATGGASGSEPEGCRFDPYLSIQATLAQQVEQRLCNAQVVSSILTGGSISTPYRVYFPNIRISV
jgi:hypothetical protein